jgi:beta-lactamase superfamily II metal-dependent hydrolase
MVEYYEIDFIDVPSKKGGDAIAIRYKDENGIKINIVDAGYQETGDKVVSFINKYYDSPTKINNVISTHQDNDHAGGLRTILENYDIGTLWMLRPWLYVDELLLRFSRFKSPESLIVRLREIYKNTAALEEIADEKHIIIKEPFQGSNIGPFLVTSPTKSFYLDMIVNSDKTPEAVVDESTSMRTFSSILAKALNYVRKAWGVETFSEEDTTCENETSVVQYVNMCEDKILLTADAGRNALEISIGYLKTINVTLPGINTIQVPHHGSRRNISSKILNELIGQKLQAPLPEGRNNGNALISASKEDEDHPRKTTIRAFIHRGYKVGVTKGNNICISKNAPTRNDYSPIDGLPYPDEEEE